MPDPALLSGLRVMIVEDEAMVSMMIEDMLGAIGCVVVTGKTAAVAVRNYNQRQLLAGNGAVLGRRQRHRTKLHLADRFSARRPHGCSEHRRTSFGRRRDQSESRCVDKRPRETKDRYE